METSPQKSTELYLEFSPGDFVYGLQERRAEVVERLRGMWSKETCRPYFTVDELNNRLLLSHAPETKDWHRETEEKSRCKFKDFRTEYEAYILEHVERYDHNDERDEERWLADACRQAINFTAIDREDGVVHFLLDGVNIQHAFQPGSKNYDSFTSQELRHVLNLCRADPRLAQSGRIRMYKNSVEQNLEELVATWNDLSRPCVQAALRVPRHVRTSDRDAGRKLDFSQF